MRHYEILLLINPDQSNQIPTMLDRYIAIITKNGGKIHRQEDWGKVQLAYPIHKLYKAHYILLNIECGVDTITELSNTFKFNDAVVRNLITKCEVAITEQSAFLRNRENERNSKDANHTNQSESYISPDTEVKFDLGDKDIDKNAEINSR